MHIYASCNSQSIDIFSGARIFISTTCHKSSGTLTLRCSCYLTNLFQSKWDNIELKYCVVGKDCKSTFTCVPCCHGNVHRRDFHKNVSGEEDVRWFKDYYWQSLLLSTKIVALVNQEMLKKTSCMHIVLILYEYIMCIGSVV